MIPITQYDDYQDTADVRAATLTPPVSPARDHIRGPIDAQLTLTEYGDFECPYCGMAYPIVKEVARTLDGRMRVAYRHFPLVNVHPHAEIAAESAEAAGVQGRFWEMHDQLFEHQDALDAPHLVDYARAIGLDEGRFVQELEDHVHADRVREDFMSGVRSGVSGTPSFFINGIHYLGPWDYETLLGALLRAEATGVTA